jgi:predicted ATP-dependent endonuclease of OLD family
MLAEKVEIQNFKSLKSSEVKLEEKITTLIGKNDNGKTNTLKALGSFAKAYKYTKEDLCYYLEDQKEAKDMKIVTIFFKTSDEDKNKLREIHEECARINVFKITKYFDNHYDIEVEEPNINMEELIKDKITRIIEKMRSEVVALSERFQTHVTRHTPFASSKPHWEETVRNFLSADLTDPQVFRTLTIRFRELPNKDVQIQTDIDKVIAELEKPRKELSDESLKIKTIKEKIMAAMPNFIYFDNIDLLKDIISVDEYLKNKTQYKTLGNLFEIAGLNVEEFKTKEIFSRRFAADQASTKITGIVNESWKQEEVKVTIGYDGGTIFVYVADKVGACDPPSKRSDGFQWFLSFNVNFMAGTRGEFKNTILLLDNPGLLLHPSGQKDLLKTLEKIAGSNQIVFTTHSPFLIDKERLERIRIVAKKDDRVGTTIKEKFYDSDFDAFEPIRAAFGVTIGDSLFGSKKNVIVEGISDYFILDGMNRYFDKNGKEHLELSDMAIVPVGGADKVPYFALIVWKEGYRFVAVLDNDSKGREVTKKLKEKYPIDDKVILKLDEINERIGEDTEIEDFFDSQFYNRAVNESFKGLLDKEIKLEELNSTTHKQTKRYTEFFKEKGFGEFDKTLVAKRILNIVCDKSCNDQILGENTIKNFERLFHAINKRLE